ncbi:dyslexia-associated protein KIAA0319-like protein homolog isoform X1 [Prionailurus iriomotensis]
MRYQSIFERDGVEFYCCMIPDMVFPMAPNPIYEKGQTTKSTDDMRIVSYRWEGINGPFREETPAKSPVLVCLTLFPETILSD